MQQYRMYSHNTNNYTIMNTTQMVAYARKRLKENPDKSIKSADFNKSLKAFEYLINIGVSINEFEKPKPKPKLKTISPDKLWTTKSKGHLYFKDDYEFFVANGEVWQVNRDVPFYPDGKTRKGGRCLRPYNPEVEKEFQFPSQPLKMEHDITKIRQISDTPLPDGIFGRSWYQIQQMQGGKIRVK